MYAEMSIHPETREQPPNCLRLPGQSTHRVRLPMQISMLEMFNDNSQILSEIGKGIDIRMHFWRGASSGAGSGAGAARAVDTRARSRAELRRRAAGQIFISI